MIRGLKTPVSLSPGDEKLLTESTPWHVGSYASGGQSFEFAIELSARALALLIKEAAKGRRVYELLSIDRPGDLLHYLRVRVADVALGLAEYVNRQYNDTREYGEPKESIRELAFTEFDGYFWLDADDTNAEAALWRQHCDSTIWKQHLKQLFSVARKGQAELRRCDDFLVQHEITLMGQRRHHCDFIAQIDRAGQLAPGAPAPSTLPADLFELIMRLAKQEDVRSVSCPLTDYWLWRELVAEQVRRSLAQGVEPEAALLLSGPDSGVPFVYDHICRAGREWGGDIHIPFEGACSADLFIQPEWFGFGSAEARVAPTLSQAVFGPHAEARKKTCTYLLTRWGKLGEIASATRTVVGEWVLYGPNAIELQQIS